MPLNSKYHRKIARVALVAVALIGAAQIVRAGGWDERSTPHRNAQAQPVPGLPAGSRVLRDIAYGDDPRQRYDAYLPASPRHAPVIFIVHGGSWTFGDKDHPGLIGNKAAYWLPKGYALVSINYRMLPDTPPLEQAKDVARALATAQRQAKSWGADRDRFVLMGHSAGAHLVALLATAPELAVAAGASPARAAVLLDSAAYDVERLMRERHPPLYDRAFGKDPAAWKAASPYGRLSPGALPMLAVCSKRHLMSACAQARKFADKAGALGARVQVREENLSHMEVNRTLGEASPYTETVAAFVAVNVR